MPKRSRSEEEENYSGLIKNHISEREVNNGVLKVKLLLKNGPWLGGGGGGGGRAFAFCLLCFAIS